MFIALAVVFLLIATALLIRLKQIPRCPECGERMAIDPFDTREEPWCENMKCDYGQWNITAARVVLTDEP